MGTVSTECLTLCIHICNAIPFPGKNQKSDAGVYWCVARNRYGEARSKNASLRIAYLKDEFRARPKNVQAIVGQEAILECSAPKGYPEPSVFWKKARRMLFGFDSLTRVKDALE